MSKQDLNARILELLKEKLDQEESVIVICICCNPNTGAITQLVGPGVPVESLPGVMMDAFKNIQTEIRNKQS